MFQTYGDSSCLHFQQEHFSLHSTLSLRNSCSLFAKYFHFHTCRVASFSLDVSLSLLDIFPGPQQMKDVNSMQTNWNWSPSSLPDKYRTSFHVVPHFVSFFNLCGSSKVPTFTWIFIPYISIYLYTSLTHQYKPMSSIQ